MWSSNPLQLYPLVNLLVTFLAMSAPVQGAPVAVALPAADAIPAEETTEVIEERAPSKVWVPAVGTTWQIVINKPLSIDPKKPVLTPDVAVYDIDLFDNSAQTIDTLHKLGKKVICYFSAGTWEKWRPDAKQFAKADLGRDMDGWADEKWLDLNSDNVRAIMAKRIKMAADKGCDAIDPDNVDGFVSPPPQTHPIPSHKLTKSPGQRQRSRSD
jgi:hypothetical protein